MFSYLSIAITSVLAYWVVTRISSLFRNIALAKASGLPYHVSPFDGMPGYLHIALEPVTQKLIDFVPFLRNTRLPLLASTQKSWDWQQRVTEQLGENYLVVSPGMIYLNSQDPEAIYQLLHQRHNYVKSLELYAIVDIFGRSMISSEGEEWRRHRKVIGPAFAERSNLLVWKDSLRQATGMLRDWARQPGSTMDDMQVSDALHNCAHLALNVISGAGFGVSQGWEGESEEELGDDVIPGFNTVKLTAGHTLSFREALQDLVDGIIWMMLVPRWMLKANSPFKMHKKLIRAHSECTAYFNELADYKINLLQKGNKVDSLTMDLMAPMVKASQVSPEESNVYLTRKDVVADSWLLLFAGHETTANTLLYTLVLLATQPDTQREVQAVIDSIVGNKPQSEWSYERDMGALYNSLVGGCFFETLRLVPPILQIPKTTGPRPQALNLKGVQHIVPPEVLIHADHCGVSRNPKYWPHSASKRTDSLHDMNDWVPSRWFLHHKDAAATTSSNGTTTTTTKSQPEEENIDGLEKASFESTSSTGIYVPPKGTFIPFADGPRACPGRRFAQVELTAVLASLLKTHTFELDVSKWASDEEVERMGREERKRVYEKAVENAWKKVGASVSIITVKMVGSVGLRVVRRGGERFGDCY